MSYKKCLIPNVITFLSFVKLTNITLTPKVALILFDT